MKTFKKDEVKNLILSKYASPIGELTLCSDYKNLVGLWLKNQKFFGSGYNLTKAAFYKESDNLEIFKKVNLWLDEYFKGKNPEIKELPLKPEGSDFRKSVWKILCKIPYGKTVTYNDIAKEIARSKNINKMSAQAVGGAIGHNPISIIIPCHRVVGANKNLTGYASGISAKIALLKLEKVDVDNFIVPNNL